MYIVPKNCRFQYIWPYYDILYIHIVKRFKRGQFKDSRVWVKNRTLLDAGDAYSFQCFTCKYFCTLPQSCVTRVSKAKSQTLLVFLTPANPLSLPRESAVAPASSAALAGSGVSLSLANAIANDSPGEKEFSF